MPSQEAEEIAAGVVLLGVAAAYWFGTFRRGLHHERAVLREHAHAIRAHYAAIEAAEDNPSYSPDAIEQFVNEVVTLVNGLWRKGAIGSVDGRPDARLVRAWAQSWQAQLGSGLKAVGKPSVDVLSVINRNDEEEDRVVVRVRLRIYCKHPSLGTLPGGLFAHHKHLDERWILGRTGNRLVLLSWGGDPLAEPVLTAPLIPTPSSDTERLREESLAELADAQKVGDDVNLADLVSADEAPTLALLDLSIVDGRFLPALIAAELAHLLESWEAAVTGSEAPFETLASANARSALLRPGPGCRLVMRDAVLKSWNPTKLNLSQNPPTVEVMLHVDAVRYLIGTDGGHLAGDDTNAHRIALKWILELTASAQTPWRLITSNNPAQAIPAWDGFRPSALELD